jgi:hypothetical protein
MKQQIEKERNFTEQ